MKQDIDEEHERGTRAEASDKVEDIDNQDFERDVAEFGRGAPSSSKGSSTAPPTKQQKVTDVDSGADEEIKASIKNAQAVVKRAHSAWDRTKREAAQVLKASATHKNTRGSAVALDLQKLMDAGTKLDDVLLDFETKCEQPTDEQAKQAPAIESTAEKLKGNMTQMRKKMGGLRALWKM